MMELLTHDGEHDEIGDGGRLMMTMATDSPLRSPERTPDQPSREVLGLGGGSVSYNAMNPSLWFFSPRTWIYGVGIEVGGASAGPWDRGARPRGGAPLACDQVVAPLRLIISPIFFINSKNILRKFSGQSENFYFYTKITPRQFCWKQRQSGLVPFKSCKLESKTRAKEFGKVDTMETYQLPQV